MEPHQRSSLVRKFCHSIFELRYKLRRVIQQKLKDAGISISFDILEIIKILSTQNLNQQDLADMLFKDKSNMTYLIDNMVKAGLAVRKEDEADRRNKLIYLTEKARDLQGQLLTMVDQCYLSLAEEITDEEIKAGVLMLAKMNNSLTDVPVL